MLWAMRDFCRLIWWVLVGLFRSRAALEAENLMLRQQLNVLRRTGPGLYRLFPDVRAALTIVKPDTVIRWHRMGFKDVLALEVEIVSWGTAARAAGGTAIDPRHEPC
jgi:hypothetical protein